MRDEYIVLLTSKQLNGFTKNSSSLINLGAKQSTKSLKWIVVGGRAGHHPLHPRYLSSSYTKLQKSSINQLL